MKIKKNDQIIVISGKDKGKKAKVLQVFPAKAKVLLENLNMRKKHIKPKKSGEKGEMVQIPVPLDASNVKLVCSKCGQPTRVGYKIVAEKKFRICKKCQQEV
jgi:large subunit ribosomal protein L24